MRDQSAVLETLRNPAPQAEVWAALRAAAGWMVWSSEYQCLGVATTAPGGLEEITTCAEEADRYVRQLPWFQRRHADLEWDDLSLCYRLRPSTQPEQTL